MPERPTLENRELPIEEGSLVMLKNELTPKQVEMLAPHFVPGEKYRVTQFDQSEEGDDNHAVWLVADGEEPTKKGLPISIRYVRRIAN